MATTTFAAGAYAAAQNLPAASGGGRALAKIGDADEGGKADFGAMLQGALASVAETGQKADTQAMAAASGKTDLVDVVTAVAESETAVQSLVAVRDRVISAYEEILRMQI
jgi:flagellar hook-basal body complex protein FliE